MAVTSLSMDVWLDVQVERWMNKIIVLVWNQNWLESQLHHLPEKITLFNTIFQSEKYYYNKERINISSSSTIVGDSLLGTESLPSGCFSQ